MMKRFQRSLGRNALYSTRWLISRLPQSVFKFFFLIFMAIGSPIINIKKKIVLKNLNFAFGHEKDQQHIKKIADDYFNNFGKGMIDLIWFLDRPQLISQKVSIIGKTHLEQALKGGKGVVLISAHFGSFILMYLRMALEGYKTNVIMRRMRDQDFEEYISEFRSENGIRTIYDLPARQCIQQSIKALRKNELLFILLDQNYGGAGGVFVDFFGHQAATATGPVIFSNRTGSPILPIFILHDQGDRHKIVIEPPVELEKSHDDQQTLVRNVAMLTKIIEQYIRRYPHEWGGWMHRRWKSQPILERSADT